MRPEIHWMKLFVILDSPTSRVSDQRQKRPLLLFSPKDLHSGHGVDPRLRQEILKVGREFFMLPLEEKEKISINNQKVPVRGYQRAGDNITAGRADWHEGLDLYRELPREIIDHLPRSPLHTNNQWPDNPANFRAVSEQYIDAMLTLGRHVMEGVARASGLSPDFFTPFYDRSYWVMRFIYYPRLNSLPENRQLEDFGCGNHTDYGCLTFVHSEHVKGVLEVQHVNGEWITADPIEDTFIVNVGDMLALWTDFSYRSTPHRVHTPTDTDRVSVPFFFEPNWTARIRPINAFSSNHGEEGRQTPSIVFGEHLAKRVLSNFRYSPHLEDNQSRDIHVK